MNNGIIRPIILVNGVLIREEDDDKVFLKPTDKVRTFRFWQPMDAEIYSEYLNHNPAVLS